MLKLSITLAFKLLLFQQSGVEMADNFRGEGKIYVVVAVILMILIGIFIALFRIDRRLNLLEKEGKSKEE